MSFLNEKFGSLTGVSHTESRYLFRILLWLYDIGEKSEEIDDEILDVINESGFNDVFGISDSSSYASDIYEHFVHNNIPENQKLMIEMKFRLQTIYDILKSIYKMIDETEFKNIKTLVTNVMNKLDKMIKKCQIL